MRRLFYFAATVFIVFVSLPVSAQQSIEASRRGFDLITKRLPALLDEECKSLMNNKPPNTVQTKNLVSKADIMRLLSDKEAKISVTFEGQLRYGASFEGKFDMYLRYFDRYWTVSRWEASWNRENPGRGDVDWVRPMNFFAHKVVLLVDKITEK